MSSRFATYCARVAAAAGLLLAPTLGIATQPADTSTPPPQRAAAEGVKLALEGTSSQNDPRLQRGPSNDWYRHVVSWTQTPVDLSFLNENEKPAGKRGFVKAKGDGFVFEDGTPARFWGTNITAFALYHTPDNAVLHHAKRLSRLGFNLVRIHHHDSSWIGFNIFGLEKDYNGSLNPTALKKLDYWVKCLKDEGIYVWLDLQVGRQYAASEGIANFGEISKGQPRAPTNAFAYINTDVQKLMQRFNEAYLGHVNTFTNVRNRDEPAIIANAISNENDLASHGGHSFLPDKGVPAHSKIYISAAEAFARKHNLDPGQTWQSWVPGPSKLLLSDLEHNFNQVMLDHLRAIKARSLLVTTNFFGEADLSVLMAMSDGDFIDVHAYGQPDEFRYNPHGQPSMISWLATAAVAGKPLTVSEWNLGSFPAFDRAGAVPHVAAIASLQGWAGLMQYAYTQADLRAAGAPENWASANDPALIATLPVAALLYRQGHVAPARKTYVLTPSRDQIMAGVSPRTSMALRTLPEVSKLRIALPSVPELPWLKPSAPIEGAVAVTDMQLDGAKAEQSQVCSDTNEICRDWEDGVLTIDTARSQIAAGWIGSRPSIELGNLEVAVSTPHATLALQSLDGQDIGQSRSLIFTATARSNPSPGNRIPFLSEPVEGTVRIKAAAGLKAYAIAGDGSRRPLALSYSGGRYTLELTRELQTFWVALTAS